MQGKRRNKVQWRRRLLPLILVTFLLAGTVGLLMPVPALAAEGDINISGLGLNGEGITNTQSQLRGQEPLSDGVVAKSEKTMAPEGAAAMDWTLQLSGAREATIDKAYFEQGLNCSPSHRAFWTDGDDNVWGGMPLWLLVGMVDDDPDDGFMHFNFNDDLAAQNYQVKIISGDENSVTFDGAAIARNNEYIVANTLNGEPLPLQTDEGKDCWPLYLKGPAVSSGQQIGNIVRIELSGIPGLPVEWTLESLGDVGDTITREEFEEGLACAGSHYKEWTDQEGNVWSGMPLWVLLGVVDDDKTVGHWTFNDARAADGYTVKVVAKDGFSKTFNSADIARNDNYIVANKINGEPLTDKGPLRLVGAAVTKEDGSLGGSAVGNIVKIEIPELQTPPAEPGSWNLALDGKISDVFSQAEFEAAFNCCHAAEWTDGDGNKWSGIPLWLLAGWVDDRQPHKYDFNQAKAGYTILVKDRDGYTQEFASADVAKNSDYIVAHKCDGEPLTDSWPLRLVGAGVAKDGFLGDASIGNIVEIELTSFKTDLPVPETLITIKGDGVEREVTFTLAQLEAMRGDENKWVETCSYSTINTWPTKKFYLAEGVKLKALLDEAGLKPEATLITFRSKDYYRVIFTKKELLEDERYYYPGLKDTGAGDGEGYLLGSTDGATLVDTILALNSTDADEAGYMNDLLAPMLVMGQRWVTEQSNHCFAKWVETIEVTTDSTKPLERWASPTAEPESGIVAVETEVKLYGPRSDYDKVHYTTDGSTPTLESPMFNWIASRWWSSREDVLEEINKPIVIAEDTTIKAVVIGHGNADSEIVTFEYWVPSGKPIYLVVPAENDVYSIGATLDGIKTMTVKEEQTGFKYFTIGIEPIRAHEGTETAVFTHLRDELQLELNASVADFDVVDLAKAGFNVQPGDVIKAYIVDQLTNDPNCNPVVLH
jgi:DMSO/TMAO reductase YedYZ molybdopterin-dependent catalytic subunit